MIKIVAPGIIPDTNRLANNGAPTSTLVLSETIAKFALGEDVLWTAGIRLDLLAQVPDVAADVPRLIHVLWPPHLTQEALWGKDVPSVLSQAPEEPELCRRQADNLLTPQHSVALEINGQFATAPR